MLRSWRTMLTVLTAVLVLAAVPSLAQDASPAPAAPPAGDASPGPVAEPGASPAPGAPADPIPPVQAAINQAKAMGKDIGSLQGRLDTLATDWKTIQDLQRELQSRASAFGPKMQALAEDVRQLLTSGTTTTSGAAASPSAGGTPTDSASAQASAVPGDAPAAAGASPGAGAGAGAASGNNTSPVEALQTTMETLKASGIDVSDLQPTVDALKPDWDSIQSRQQEMASGRNVTAQRAQALQKDITDFQQRIQALAQQMADRASKATGGAPQGQH